ncbi:MAG TPA: AAA family ATPase [Clostridiales bacterium UBA8153]|nr:AAA family ATPase [Clostridiales bacterium UBA8153]
MRPRALAEFVGQDHLVGEGTLLRRALARHQLFSMILYGPPGTGKTALAALLAGELGTTLHRLSATTAGVKDIREAGEPGLSRGTLLFIDEVHRLTRVQQDTLLPLVEKGLLFLGATTENPYIALSPAVLSRCKVMEFKPLQAADLARVLERALAILAVEHGQPVIVEPQAREHLVAVAQGDCRQLLNAVELAVLASEGVEGTLVVGTKAAEEATGRVLVHDAGGDAHYDVVSALIKSMRGSDPDAALHYLARMIAGGEDPRYIARRIMVHAAEDVGIADPRALEVAVAAAQAVERVGLPEGRIPLAEAVIYICLCPKSNAVVTGIDRALADIARGKTGPVPMHLRDASYAGAGKLGRGAGYRYPHDFPGHLCAQQYLPSGLEEARYYEPSEQGLEERARRRLDQIRAVLRNQPGRG